MIAIPAIDIIDGRCVRLLQGQFDKKSVYGKNPVEMAQSFTDAGVSRLHVVDLDAARGTGNNRNTIAAIRRVFPGIIEVGGGLRSPENVTNLLELGIDRLILSTMLVQRPDEMAIWSERFGPVFIAGIDAMDGMVKISGWEMESNMRAVDLAAKAKQLGMTELIYTDIARDGTMSGPNLEQTMELARTSNLPVIISGGISGMDDLKNLAASELKGVSGVIFGKAFYEGRINLTEAIRLLEGRPV